MKNSSIFTLSFVLLIISCQTSLEKSQAKVTIQEVESGIKTYIERKAESNDDFFQFENDTIELSLKLVRVHTEYLSVLGSNEYFACVDLATSDGDVYDMDFFLTGKPGAMKVTRTTLHKLNGKPYYTWKQNKQEKTWFIVPIKNANNQLLGVIEKKDAFSFTYEVLLPELSGPSQLWIPIAQSDSFQTIAIKSLWAPGQQKISHENEFNNSYLHLELLPEHSGSKITIVYDVKRLEKAPYISNELEIDQYLLASKFLPVGGRFKVIADSVIASRDAGTSLMKARALYDYIIDNLRYAKEGKYGTGDANYACDAKSGNCTEFHSLFISLARSAQIPARFAVGAAIPSERNDGGINGYHCWAEFYAEGKWWPVDISEGNKYTALATYYFGHHPANRIEFSKGRDIAPDPLPVSGAINFFAYPVLEIEGKPAKVKTTFNFLREIEPTL
jgi:transglutaminase-like putative cysteine protease